MMILQSVFCDDKPRINVNNKGRRGIVNGDVNAGPIVQAFVPNPENETAKLKVSGLQRFVWRTNYWVVAAGTYDDALLSSEKLKPQPSGTDNDWVIVAGAAPF